MTTQSYQPLQWMLDQQLELQTVMPPHPNRATNPDPQVTCEYIKDNCLAGIAELVELMDETGWKPWSSSWHVNVEAARKEWIDAWHFMMNLANKLEMSESMIVTMYAEKHAVNRHRQEVGYDGVSTKCPECKRELDTEGSLTLVIVSVDHPQMQCTGCGYVFTAIEATALATAGVPAPVGP